MLKGCRGFSQSAGEVQNSIESERGGLSMAGERKTFARYVYNTGLRTFWKGDASKSGSQFRSIAMTTDSFANTGSIYQVYGLEGTGRGIVNGKFAGTEENTKVLFDKDFQGLEAAAKQFSELADNAQTEGFKLIDFMEWLEYESRLSS
jgi:hypothetical protein